MSDELKEQVSELLGFFGYQQLPPHLQMVSMPFHQLAHELVGTIDWSWELLAGLRDLLRAKDAAVRAALLAAKKRESAKSG